MTRSNLIDVEVCKHYETEKAYLVSIDAVRENAVWIAKSMCELEPTGKASIWILTLPEDLATEKKLT